MRLSLVAAAVAVLTASFPCGMQAQQSDPAQPFGLRIGTPIAILRDQLGAQPATTRFNGWFVLAAPPLPDSRFDSFQLFASPVSGLCDIVAIRTDIASGANGEAARQAYATVRDSLDIVYGQSSFVGGLISGVAEGGADQWMRSIYRRERTYRASWFGGAPKVPSEFGSIALTLEADSEEAAKLVLRFHRARSRECSDEVIAAERAAQ